jgi:hypothetical protein
MLSIEKDESYLIEDVSSDDEPKIKRKSSNFEKENFISNDKKNSILNDKEYFIQNINSQEESIDRFSSNNDYYSNRKDIKAHISQVSSPLKVDKLQTIESRCFLKFSKKIDKLIHQHNLSKLNALKNTQIQSKTLIYDLLETVYIKREERSRWLSLNKKDDARRSSLFLRLTEVRAARNGFLDCECVIDLDKMKDVIEFKYYRLKTLIPKHYANEFEISNQVLLEYISPWNVYNNDHLKISFIINPFWIHILEHGSEKSNEKEKEVEFLNPNLDNKMLI